MVFFSDARGEEYAGLDRVVGIIAHEPVLVHRGLAGFLGAAIVPPGIQVVMHRQVVSRKREERRKSEL